VLRHGFTPEFDTLIIKFNNLTVLFLKYKKVAGRIFENPPFIYGCVVHQIMITW
ncbi:uncharacterized protein METZ01_LOCUS62071, partial [marine metagenome]